MDGETYDYGLDPDESFIPEDLDESDATQPHIMTVLGPIMPGALGATNASATLAGLVLPDHELANEGLLTEIEEAGFAGIGAFVASDAIRSVDELAPLRWLAERSNLHLIYGYSPVIASTVDEELARTIEIALQGFGEAAVRPGYFRSNFEQLSVALTAREETGTPVVATLTAADIDMLISAAPDELDGVIARFPDPVDLDRLLDLAEAGAWILFDGIEGNSAENQTIAMTIAELASAGHLESILIGYSPQTVPESVSYGVGSRWSYLIEQFPLLVLEAGLDAMAMRTILIENPNAAFTIYPPQ